MSAVAPLPRRLAALPRRLLRLRSDAALGERFATGDDTAFAVLYERHAPSVLAVCIGVVGDRQDAEDAAQETFAALAVALRDDPPRELRPWLVRVARNASIDLLRRRRAKPSGSGADEDLDRAGQDDEGFARVRRPVPVVVDLPIRTELQSVLAGIRELPASQRTALLLRELAGHSYAEIGALLEIDEQAVRGLIARARGGLRNYREATELPCAVARAEIAGEPDGRRYDRTVRRHLRRCEGCRAYRDAIRGDARVLRGLAPLPAGGLAGGGAFVGLAAKGALTGSVLGQAGAVCAVSVCSVGGAVLLYPHALAVLGHHGPVPLSASRGPAGGAGHAGRAGDRQNREGGVALAGASAGVGGGLGAVAVAAGGRVAGARRGGGDGSSSGLTTAGRGTVRPAGVVSAGTRTSAGTLTWTVHEEGGAGGLSGAAGAGGRPGGTAGRSGGGRHGEPGDGPGDGPGWNWGRGWNATGTSGGSGPSAAAGAGAGAGASPAASGSGGEGDGAGDGESGPGSSTSASGASVGGRGSGSTAATGTGAGTDSGIGAGVMSHPSRGSEGSVGATPVVATGGADPAGDGTVGGDWRSRRAEPAGTGQEGAGDGGSPSGDLGWSPSGAGGWSPSGDGGSGDGGSSGDQASVPAG